MSSVSNNTSRVCGHGDIIAKSNIPYKQVSYSREPLVDCMFVTFIVCRHLFVGVIRRTHNKVTAPFSEQAAALVMNNRPATWTHYDGGRPDREMQEAVDGMHSFRQQLYDMARSEQQQVSCSTPAAIGRDGELVAATAQAWVTSADYVSDCSSGEESDSSSDADGDSADEGDEPECGHGAAPQAKPSTSRAALQLSYAHNGIAAVDADKQAEGPTFPQPFAQLVQHSPTTQIQQRQTAAVQQQLLLGSRPGAVMHADASKLVLQQQSVLGQQLQPLGSRRGGAARADATKLTIPQQLVASGGRKYSGVVTHYVSCSSVVVTILIALDVIDSINCY